jgi:hypothetical protein
MSKNIQIQQDNLLNAYKNASSEQRELLEHLFGSEVFKPKDVRERIKTFHDAYCALGNEHPFVVSYEKYVNTASGEEADVIAYLQLRIITAALNEGWEPQFVPGEYRWAPYFVLYTKEEIEKMNAQTRARVVFRSSDNANASGGVSYANAGYGSAYVSANIGSRLAFKSEELAEYAGKQFLEIYADLCFIPNKQ